MNGKTAWCSNTKPFPIPFNSLYCIPFFFLFLFFPFDIFDATFHLNKKKSVLFLFLRHGFDLLVELLGPHMSALLRLRFDVTFNVVRWMIMMMLFYYLYCNIELPLAVIGSHYNHSGRCFSYSTCSSSVFSRFHCNDGMMFAHICLLLLFSTKQHDFLVFNGWCRRE